jgi:periplasmic protein TonB
MMIEAFVLAIAAQAALAAPSVSTAPAVERARARANLPSYISVDDYPASAVQSGAEGTVRFSLDVDPTGRVSGCRITGTSGTPALDDATCGIMRSRARFTPARDSQGNAVPDSFQSSITWRLRGEPRPAPGP